MVKFMLISIVLMWTVALVLPQVLKFVKHRKEKGSNDDDSKKDSNS